MRYELEDGTVLHTGKLPARTEPGTKMFHDYVDSTVIDLSGPPPEAASSLGHASLMPSPRLMLANGPDASIVKTVKAAIIAKYGVGCCVYAMFGNKHRLSWAVAKRGLFPTDGDTTLLNYEVTGYDPAKTEADGSNSTDQGTDMLTAMKQQLSPDTAYVDATGARHVLGAFCAIDLSRPYDLEWAVYLDDSGVPVGQMLGNKQMAEFNRDQEWTQGELDDGHCTLLDRELYMETWARDQKCSKGYVFGTKTEPHANLDEAYLTVDEEGLVNGKSIEGFDSQQLLADVKAGA